MGGYLSQADWTNRGGEGGEKKGRVGREEERTTSMWAKK